MPTLSRRTLTFHENFSTIVTNVMSEFRSHAPNVLCASQEDNRKEEFCFEKNGSEKGTSHNDPIKFGVMLTAVGETSFLGLNNVVVQKKELQTSIIYSVVMFVFHKSQSIVFSNSACA